MLLAIDIQSVQRFILFSDIAQKYNNWVRDGFSCQKVKDSDGACRDHLVIRLPTEDVSLPARQPSLVAGCGARSHPAEARHRRQPPHPATRGSPAARALPWTAPQWGPSLFPHTPTREGLRRPGLLGSEPLTLFSNGWQPGRAGAGSPASCLGVSAGRAETKAIAALTANTAPSVRAQAMSRSPGRREKCFQLAIRPAGRGHRHRCSGPSGPSQHLHPGWHSCQPAGTLLSAATKHLNSPKQTDQQELSPCGPTSLAVG